MTAFALPWIVLIGYCALVWHMTPVAVTTDGFFGGTSRTGARPGLWLLVASAAITWIFAKSIANSAGLAHAFGVTGAVGYALYYLVWPNTKAIPSSRRPLDPVAFPSAR